jgi:UDP-N-acetylmuramoyl-tripeptide--D-alanyl-D-alanine ligase
VPGSLFFALPGAVTDGHLFLSEAEKKGAAAAVVRRGFVPHTCTLPLFYVDDTIDTLQNCAQKWLHHSSAKIIAITGSLGKTTTKNFLYNIMKSRFRVMATSGSKNSQIGLALSILNETMGDEEYLILEMGMSDTGHIKRLTRLAPPDIALITYIALVHAEKFSALDGIAAAKAEVFSHPKTGLVIVNRDSPCFDFLWSKIPSRKESYSIEPDSGATWSLTRDENKLQVVEQGKKYSLDCPAFPARHIYMNLIAAIATARSCGMSFEEIGKALPTLVLPKRRLERIEKRGITFIDDAYNAAEPSMKGALEAVASMGGFSRKVAVFGPMKELGVFSDECHVRVGQYALDKVDMLFCFGPECLPLAEVWKREGRPVSWCLDFDELIGQLRKNLVSGDLVLVKGSLSTGLKRAIDML